MDPILPPPIIERCLRKSILCLTAALLVGACGGPDDSPIPPGSRPDAQPSPEPTAERPSSYNPSTARTLLIQSIQTDDPVRAEASLKQATTLAPSLVDGWLLLAAARVRQDDFDGAFESLDRISALGIRAPVDQYEPLAPLQEDPRWADLITELDRQAQPRGASDVLFRLPEKDLLTEDVAYDRHTDSWYVSAVHGRKIIRISHDGSVDEWLASRKDVWGVFGLAIDGERRRLWATTAAMPQMRGFDADDGLKTALLKIDLDDAEIISRHALPTPSSDRSHAKTDITDSGEEAPPPPAPQLNDLAVAADGSVYATDLTSPGGIYRLRPGGDELERVGEEMMLNSPQGIVLLRDGSVLLVADYSLGLAALDLATGASWFVEPPPDLWLQALDGLAANDDGELVAIQNGRYPPHRILHLKLSDDLRRVVTWRVAAQALPEWREPTLGTILYDGAEPSFVYVAASQWPLFPDAAEPDSAELEAPRIMSLTLSPLPSESTAIPGNTQ